MTASRSSSILTDGTIIVYVALIFLVVAVVLRIGWGVRL